MVAYSEELFAIVGIPRYFRRIQWYRQGIGYSTKTNEITTVPWPKNLMPICIFLCLYTHGAACDLFKGQAKNKHSNT